MGAAVALSAGINKDSTDYLVGDRERGRAAVKTLYPHLLKYPFYRPLLSLVFQLLGHLSSSHFSYLRGERGEE